MCLYGICSDYNLGLLQNQCYIVLVVTKTLNKNRNKIGNLCICKCISNGNIWILINCNLKILTLFLTIRRKKLELLEKMQLSYFYPIVKKSRIERCKLRILKKFDLWEKVKQLTIVFINSMMETNRILRCKILRKYKLADINFKDSKKM